MTWCEGKGSVHAGSVCAAALPARQSRESAIKNQKSLRMRPISPRRIEYSKLDLSARRSCSPEGPGYWIVHSVGGSSQACESRPGPSRAGESLPRNEPLRVGNGLDPLADLLRQLDDDSLRA